MSTSQSRGSGVFLRSAFFQLTALWALAAAQPVLQMIKENTDFLVVHHSALADVLVLVPALFLLVPLLGAVLAALVHRIRQGAGELLLAGELALVAALGLLPLLQRIPAAGGPVVLAGALAGGVLFFLAYRRLRPLRDNLSGLAWVAPLFLVVFFLDGSVNRLLFAEAAPPEESGVTSDQSVVMLILDEFPLASLLKAPGELDCELFPNFCRLAELGTWYPNATTVSPATLRSVPCIMTGLFPEWQKKAVLAEHPRNIFTLLGSSHRVISLEAQTDLCPPELKSEPVPGLGQRLDLLFQDLWILSQHLFTPQQWRDHLVPIGDKWGNFLDSEEKQGQRLNRIQELENFIDSIQRGKEPQLAVAHVLLPHSQYIHLPDGRVYNRRRRVPATADNSWGPDAVKMLHSYRRHLLQVVAVDRLVGRLLDRLEDQGLLDRTALVLVADHGLAFRTGVFRRRFADGAEADIMSVPLFIKEPAQTRGRVDTTWAQTVDIMPTLVAALGVDPGWEFDGRNLLTGDPGRTTLDFLDQDEYREKEIDPGLMASRQYAIDLKHRSFGEHGDYQRLFSLDDAHGLLGTPVADLVMAADCDLQGRLLEPQDLKDVDLKGNFLPAEINGLVMGRLAELQEQGDGRLLLALALNGRLAGYTRTYLRTDAPGDGDEGLAWQVTVSPRVFRPGRNTAELFLVRRNADGDVFCPIPLSIPSYLGKNLGGRRVNGIVESGLFNPHDWNGVWARWTNGQGTWAIPLKEGERPDTLALGLVSTGSPVRHLQVLANGTLLLDQDLPQGKWETRLPLDGVKAGDLLTVELKSNVWVPAEANPKSSDHRQLGVAISVLEVR